MNQRQKAVEDLKAWSEDAINCAELEISPSIESGKKIVTEAQNAGMNNEEIRALIWCYEDELVGKKST
jgi:hypothetical protein